MPRNINLDQYPLHQPDSAQYSQLVAQCRDALATQGLFNLTEFWGPSALGKTVKDVSPLFQTQAFTHACRHNIYFRPGIDNLPADHPAMTQMTTTNHTLCADQLADTALSNLHQHPVFIRFLAVVMGLEHLHVVADPLAGVNAMAYYEGEALNWHFDRSEFTTTLLLQTPQGGGAFEYATNLRSDSDPNYDGVGALLTGKMKPTKMAAAAGTLNVFKGRNTAHRVTPVTGETPRMIAVFSYFDRPGVAFSDQDRIGFYGRTH